MAESTHTTIPRAGARPVPTFSTTPTAPVPTERLNFKSAGAVRTPRPSSALSTIEAAHSELLARLTLARPNRIAYEADRRDLEERAEQIGAVLNATLDYVGAIVRDTAHVAPGGALSQGDQRYVLNLITDVASDVVGFITDAADGLGRD